MFFFVSIEWDQQPEKESKTGRWRLFALTVIQHLNCFSKFCWYLNGLQLCFPRMVSVFVQFVVQILIDSRIYFPFVIYFYFVISRELQWKSHVGRCCCCPHVIRLCWRVRPRDGVSGVWNQVEEGGPQSGVSATVTATTPTTTRTWLNNAVVEKQQQKKCSEIDLISIFPWAILSEYWVKSAYTNPGPLDLVKTLKEAQIYIRSSVCIWMAESENLKHNWKHTWEIYPDPTCFLWRLTSFFPG